VLLPSHSNVPHSLYNPEYAHAPAPAQRNKSDSVRLLLASMITLRPGHVSLDLGIFLLKRQRIQAIVYHLCILEISGRSIFPVNTHMSCGFSFPIYHTLCFKGVRIFSCDLATFWDHATVKLCTPISPPFRCTIKLDSISLNSNR
jgi:hypothetical protein